METAQLVETKVAKSGWVSEGIVIAAAPVVASVLALFYINGYASYFQIPTEFLSLNVNTLFVVGGRILAVVLFVLMLYFFAFQFLRGEDGPVLRRILALSPWVGLLYVQVVFFHFSWREWRSSLFYLVLLAASFFLGPLMHRGMPYMEKLREESRRVQADSSLSSRVLLSKVGFRAIVFWTLYWFLTTVSQNAGRAEAMWKTEFLVPASSPVTVVLCTYGDYLVLAPFDKQTKEIERSFYLLKKGDDPKLLLQMQAVGPLHLKGTPAVKP